MDMKKLLEKMAEFAGQAVGQKPGDQVRGTEKAKATKSGKAHPFKGRLVGDSVEPQGSMLGELSQVAKDTVLERSLAERWEEFKEEAFKDVAEKRPARKGSRPNRGHEPVPRYKKIKEITNSPTINPPSTNPLADKDAVKKAMAATSTLKAATSSAAPAVNIAQALDTASQGKPIDATKMKAIEPMMDIMNKAAQDPKLANQFKQLANQAKLVK